MKHSDFFVHNSLSSPLSYAAIPSLLILQFLETFAHISPEDRREKRGKKVTIRRFRSLVAFRISQDHKDPLAVTVALQLYEDSGFRVDSPLASSFLG